MHRQWGAPRHLCRRNGMPPACRTPSSIALSLELVCSTESASRFPALRPSRRDSRRYGDDARASRSSRSGKRKIPEGAVRRFAKEDSSAPDSVIGRDEISRMTSARRGRDDSLHLLVMDGRSAKPSCGADGPRVIDGAHVHHLDPDDRDRVAAFMRHQTGTAPLAFGHPGLATTAVRVGARLTIQNDIGETDAHVLVVHVETLGQRDLYRCSPCSRKVLFIFIRDLERRVGRACRTRGWRPWKEDVFYLMTGRFAANPRERLDAFLTFLGSRIVFLIDWNKGRKALQTFVGKNTSISLLTWAANNDVGHRAFLELGGADLYSTRSAMSRPTAFPMALTGRRARRRGDRQFPAARIEGSKPRAAVRPLREAHPRPNSSRSRAAFRIGRECGSDIIERHLGLSHTLASIIWTALAHPGNSAERQSSSGEPCASRRKPIGSPWRLAMLAPSCMTQRNCVS